MKTLDLMVDVDDVIFPTMESIHELALKAGLHDGTAKMAWSGWESYGCEPEVYWDLWSDFALKGGYVETAPIPGTAEAMRWLLWEGHRIHIVTARGFMSHAERIRAWTPEWLERWAIPHSTLTFARDKVGAMETLGVRFDSAVDDSPKNYAALDGAGVLVYLQHHEHNEAHEAPGLRRVDSLWEWAYQLEKEFPTE